MTGSTTAAPPLSRDAALRLVGRLVLVNAVVLLLLDTVLTAPGATRALLFDPAHPAERPWAVLTFPFVHTGLAHLLMVAALTALLAPEVVRRMGPRLFLGYYLACAAGAAAFGVALSGFARIPELAGGLAPLYGIALARGWFADDLEVALDPLPFRVQARSLVGLGALVLVGIGVVTPTPALSLAHAGGFLAGYLWFRIRAAGRRPAAATPLPIRRAVMTPVRLEVQESASAPARSPAPQPAPAAVPPRTTPMEADELDRLLDKISAQGLDSLTEEERQVLTQLAERKRKEGP